MEVGAHKAVEGCHKFSGESITSCMGRRLWDMQVLFDLATSNTVVGPVIGQYLLEDQMETNVVL